MLNGAQTYMLVENVTAKKTIKISAQQIIGVTEDTGTRGLLSAFNTDPAQGAIGLYRLLIEVLVPDASHLGLGSQPLRILGFYRDIKSGSPTLKLKMSLLRMEKRPR